MARAPRSTRVTLLDAELHQLAVIDALVESGDDYLAIRLARCKFERQNRRYGWPWQCRSSECWACCRATTRRWWRGFWLWLGDAATNLAVIPLNGEAPSASRKARKGRRNVRDRAAQRDWRWQSVAMAGLFSRDHLLWLTVEDAAADPAPNVPSFIRRVPLPYALAWGGLQKLLG